MTNTTFSVDICKPLQKAKGIPKQEDCPNGTRGIVRSAIVCAIERIVHTYDNTTTFKAAIPIAGEYSHTTGGSLNPTWTRLKTSSSRKDRSKEGVRLKMDGKTWPEKGGIKQQAVIDFICDRRAEEKEQDYTRLLARDEDDEEDHSATSEVTEDGHGGKLKYIGYEMVGDAKLLTLEWTTKYACEDAKARGWDLVPHSETIRDIPYIFKDWMRRVINTIQGPGSRGGYSAV
ncbi:MAG: hypothetical protein LQ342_006413 [Letrouitia transgressa]|nr:MAG: hypothetical protein LQ342_006413 [Letrouitia transgressa]